MYITIILIIAALMLLLLPQLIKGLSSPNETHNALERNFHVNKTELSQTPKTLHVRFNKAYSLSDDFIALDTETTGLDPTYEDIIQLSAIKYIDGVQKDKFNVYVNPQKSIPISASNVNGIYDKDVKDAPYINDVLPSFIEFIGDSILVAHNASFDMKFIQTAIVSAGYSPLDNKVADTLSLARKYMDTENHKLETLKNFLNIKATSHNALDDAMVTAEVYLYCKNKISATSKKSEQSNKLSEFELDCYNVILNILKNANKDISALRYSKGSTYFDINVFYILLRIKSSSRGHYALLEHNEIGKLLKELSLKPASKSEGESKIRVQLYSPNDLIHFEQIILERFVYCMEEIQNYISHTTVGLSNVQEYLNQ